ncbi:MAG: hypothetical protein ACREND_06490 [Gemmatimonadaceae bacterium]
MQSSFGEQILTVNSTRIGRVRALGVFADSVQFPRLGIRLGVELSSGNRQFAGQAVPDGALQLRDLSGELRLLQNSDAIGLVHWTGQRRGVRSGGGETQIPLVCELDPWRLSRLEQWRDGKPPRFWLQLWPALVDDKSWYDADVVGFSVDVPRETWLDVLSRWGSTHYAVLEVPYIGMDPARFQRAVEHLDTARRRLLEGAYTDCVATCRLAIEAMFGDLDAERGAGADSFADRLPSSVPRERAKVYGRVLAALKDLSHEPHHLSGVPTELSRAEAVFVVQTMAHFFALVGALTSPKDRPVL